MDWTACIRRLGVVLLLGGTAGMAQSTLPATTPTALPATNATALATTSSTGPAGAARPQANPATVSYADAQLEVIANNSSLNQILREVCRKTGMVIDGGVVEQRVYGKYGPGNPGDVLAMLLDGAGSNMLLIAGESGAPKKLILSPREGGVTPPNPNAPGFDDGYVAPEAAQFHNIDNPPAEAVPPAPVGRGPVEGAAAAAAGFGGASTTTTTSGTTTTNGTGTNGTTTNGATTNGTTTTTSPNGVLTPQQIYQQLQNLQKAQPQPPQ